MTKKNRLGSSKETHEFLESLLDDIEAGNKDSRDVANALKAVAISKDIRKMELLEKMRTGDTTPLWWLWDDSRPALPTANEPAAKILTNSSTTDDKKDKPYEFNNNRF